jgi:hypothetical protein
LQNSEEITMKNAQTLLAAMLLIAGATTAAFAVPSAPEIDPASAGSAIALVTGMALLFRARRTK